MSLAQRFLARTTVTALLALAASSAQAIPLTFAFTATDAGDDQFREFGNATCDPSRDGQAVSGAITYDDDFGALPVIDSGGPQRSASST